MVTGVSNGYDGLEITPDIPNYYGGGLIDALSLQAGVADAMKRERQASGNPRLIVASVGERILNREETRKYKQLESKGILNNAAPNFKVNNYSMGGNIGNISKGISNYANNTSNNSSNRDSHDSYSFNFGNNSRRDRMGRSASQQAAEAYERIQRERRRDGRS